MHIHFVLKTPQLITYFMQGLGELGLLTFIGDKLVALIKVQ